MILKSSPLILGLLYAIYYPDASFARIGETEEQCLVRYGAAESREIIEKNDVFINYATKNKIRIVATFRDNQCISIVYNGELSSDDTIDLLRKNCSKGVFQVSQKKSFDPTLKKWSVILGNFHDMLNARIIFGSGDVEFLLISTNAYWNEVAEEKKDKQKKRLEGF
jgi:hypothetical protein